MDERTVLTLATDILRTTHSHMTDAIRVAQYRYACVALDKADKRIAASEDKGMEEV